jgi:hypothetical protein
MRIEAGDTTGLPGARGRLARKNSGAAGNITRSLLLILAASATIGAHCRKSAGTNSVS